ncbi:hypothetical protein Mapa_003949 [Marchantia paleacea]|nr:hypothetical protein Mapa_003949 [Marchantia paleacea]
MWTRRSMVLFLLCLSVVLLALVIPSEQRSTSNMESGRHVAGEPSVSATLSRADVFSGRANLDDDYNDSFCEDGLQCDCCSDDVNDLYNCFAYRDPARCCECK